MKSRIIKINIKSFYVISSISCTLILLMLIFCGYLIRNKHTTQNQLFQKEKLNKSLMTNLKKLKHDNSILKKELTLSQTSQTRLIQQLNRILKKKAILEKQISHLEEDDSEEVINNAVKVQNKLLSDISEAIKEKEQDTEKTLPLKKNNKELNSDQIFNITHSEYLLKNLYERWDINTKEKVKEFNSLYTKAHDAFIKEDYDNAIIVFQKLLKKYPNALIGYPFLIQSLNENEEEEQKNVVIRSYLEKIREEVIQE